MDGLFLGCAWVISVCAQSCNQVWLQGKLLRLRPLIKFIDGRVLFWQVIMVGSKKFSLGDLPILSLSWISPTGVTLKHAGNWSSNILNKNVRDVA